MEQKGHISTQKEEKPLSDAESDKESSDSEFEDIENNSNELQWKEAIQNCESTYISDAKEYLKWVKSEKKVKVMEEQVPWDSNVQICDISLHRGGPLEDKKYAYFPKFRINIKRGNSVCVVNKVNGNEEEAFFCRRGMRKFYDMTSEYLEPDHKLGGYNQKVQFLTLDKARMLLEQGKHYIHLCNLFKENGEHCQISYVARFGMWLIASKNVTILVRNRSDADSYGQKIRYYWARLICDEWFNILDGLTPSQIEQLKEKMDSLTFIGEHCGNPKHQHIFKYDKVQIIFYAIVKNNSADVCLPVDQAFQIFDLFGLKTVRRREIKKLDNYQEMTHALKTELKRVGSGSMEDEGEGGVMYIVSENKETGEQQTISCCKLKTTEYNIYRKMREILKLILQKKSQAGRKNDRFKAEVESMAADFPPPKPLEFYLEIGKNAFQYVDEHLKQLSPDILRYEFLTFLDNIQKKKSQEKQDQKPQKPGRIILITPPGHFSDKFIVSLQHTLSVDQIDTQWREDLPLIKNHLSLLHILPRISEKSSNLNVIFVLAGFDLEGQTKCIERLENDSETLKQSKFSANMFQFITSKNKKQMVELLFQKIQGFIASLKSTIQSEKCMILPTTTSEENALAAIQAGFTKIITCNENKEQDNQEKDAQTQNLTGIGNQTKKRVTFIVPIALPGSGKTFFGKLLEKAVNEGENQASCAFYNISSDEIRAELMQEYGKTRKERELSHQQLFEATAINAKLRYNEAIKQVIAKVQSQDKKHGIVYLDRVTPPQNLEDILSLIDEKQDLEVRVAAYVLKSSHQMRSGKHSYLFSEQILLGCLHNSLAREDHETLVGDATYLTKICLKFFQMFRDCSVNSLASLSKISILVQLPLIVETTSNIQQSLMKKIEKSLELIPVGGNAPDSPIFTDLIQSFYAAELEFCHPDVLKLTNTANNFVKAILAII